MKMLVALAIIQVVTAPTTRPDSPFISAARLAEALQPPPTTPVEMLADAQSMVYVTSWGNVVIETPFRRVRSASVEARKKYLPFGMTEAEKLWTPTVTFHAIPDKPETMRSPVTNVEHIVVLTPTGPVQPAVIEPIVNTYSNAYGAEVKAIGQKATFPLDVLREGNEIRVIVDRAGVALGPDRTAIEDEQGNRLLTKDHPIKLTGDLLARLK